MDIRRLDRALAALDIMPIDQVVTCDSLILHLPPTDAVYRLHELTWPITEADFFNRMLTIPRAHLECVTSLLTS